MYYGYIATLEMSDGVGKMFKATYFKLFSHSFFSGLRSNILHKPGFSV
jgi:hypothetical protein